MACWGLGVPGQDMDKSWRPAAAGVELEEEMEEQGEEERAASAASFRGCSGRMDSWEKEMQILSFPLPTPVVFQRIIPDKRGRNAPNWFKKKNKKIKT